MLYTKVDNEEHKQSADVYDNVTSIKNRQYAVYISKLNMEIAKFLKKNIRNYSYIRTSSKNFHYVIR